MNKVTAKRLFRPIITLALGLVLIIGSIVLVFKIGHPRIAATALTAGWIMASIGLGDVIDARSEKLFYDEVP